MQSTKNDKSDGEIRKIIDESGGMNNKSNVTNSLYELEQDNKLFKEEATSESSSNDRVMKEDGEKKQLDLAMLTRSQKSRLTGPNTQPCIPLGSKKAPGQNVENSFSSHSRKYIFACLLYPCNLCMKDDMPIHSLFTLTD